MKKTIVFFTLCAMLLALCFPVWAQEPKKVPRIGYLVTGSASAHSARREAFQKGLRDLGYVEGQNLVIEYRYAEGKIERLPDLAAELVRLKLEVIVASPTESIRAAMSATKKIPIVMATAGDPVAAGFVVSLAHPGGNVTGSSQMSPELGGKRLELLKESFKKVFVVAVLHTGIATQTVQMKEMELAARALGVQPQPVKIEGQSDLETALSVITKGRATALTG